jgi:putative membrane protein
MTMDRTLPTLLSGLLLACSATAADKSPVASGDRKFVEAAARAGMAEVESAQLAKGKADSQAIKDFARRMEDDHNKANEALRKLADAKGVALPPETDVRHRRLQDRLRGHTAAQFEREYIDHQVSDHRHVISDFEKEAKKGHDADLRKWAGEQLPILREHLRMAQSVQEDVKAGKSKPAQQPAQDTSGAMKR